MSEFNKDKIKEMLQLNNGTFNSEIIDYVKRFVIERLRCYLDDETIINSIERKINDIQIVFVDNTEFEEIYVKNRGKGFLPGAFVANGIIYFLNYSDDYHQLVHEIMHLLAQNNDKRGFLQILRDKNQYYGEGFNEAFTEYITSIILDENFSGYSIDFYYIIILFMLLTDLDIKSTLKLYLGSEEWLSDSLISRFNSTNSDLEELVIEYDQRLPRTQQRKFNPDNVLRIIINSLKQKVSNNSVIKTDEISEILKKYYNYFEEWHHLSVETSEMMGEILDILGTYRGNHDNPPGLH